MMADNSKQPVSGKLLALGKAIDVMVQVGEEDNKQWLEMYNDAVHYTYGNQLRNVELKKGHRPIQVNYLIPALNQTMAFISQQKTTMIANPAEETDRDGAMFVQGLQQYRYEMTLGVQARRVEWLQTGFLNGAWTALVMWNEKPKRGWNAELRKWEGEPEIIDIPPADVGIDPLCRRADLSDAEFVWVREEIPLDRAVKQWPENKEEIEVAAQKERDLGISKGDAGGIIVTGSQEAATRDGAAYKTGTKDAGPEGLNQGRLANLLMGKRANKFYRKDGDKDKPAKVTMLRIWFEDRETRTQKPTRRPDFEELVESGRAYRDEETGLNMLIMPEAEPVPLEETNWPEEPEQEYEEPVYPNGRYVERIGDVILNPDEKDQVWPMKRWPVFVGRFRILPRTWRGLNGVEIEKSLQDYVNETAINVLAYLKFHSQPRQMVEPDALLHDEKKATIGEQLAIGAASIIKFKRGRMAHGFKVEPPPQFPAGIMTVFQLLTNELRNQTQIHEIIQGVRGGPGTTATEALRLEANSRVHIALLMWLLDGFTLDVMEYVLELDHKHLSPGDQVRVVGPKGIPGAQEFAEGSFDAQFDLRMEVGSSLPFDRERKQNKALILHKSIGAAYLPRLLDEYEVPNPEEILENDPNYLQSLLLSKQLRAELEQPETTGLAPPMEQAGAGGQAAPEEAAEAGTKQTLAEVTAGTGLQRGAGGTLLPETGEQQ